MDTDICVCLCAYKESQATEDNAGNVLIPGYRVFIVVRPSGLRLWVDVLRFLRNSEISLRGHRPHQLRWRFDPSHRHSRIATNFYVTLLSQGLLIYYALGSLTRCISTIPKVTKIYVCIYTAENPHILHRFGVSENNSTYLRYSLIDSTRIL